MKFLILSLFCTLALSSSKISLDTHVHLESNQPAFFKEHRKIIKKYKIQHSLALSSSYLAHFYNHKTDDMSQVQYDKIIDSYVKQENNYIAKIVKSFPDDYTGMCSVPWRYHKAIQELERCIKLGLKGIKLHQFTYKNFKQDQIF